MWENVKAWFLNDTVDEIATIRFEFGAPLGVTLGLILIVVAGIVAVRLYWPRLARLPRPARAMLVTLRTAVILLALFMLLDPCIVGDLVRPGEQFLILLFDDSKSMKIAGEDGLSRGDGLLKAYQSGDSRFENELEETFRLLRYRFGTDIERIDRVDELTFSRPETDIVGAIERAARDLEGAGVSGAVLFSDGVQQPAIPESDLDRLADLSIPIFTVGTDTASVWRDLELGRMSVKRTAFDKSPVVLSAHVAAEGLSGREAVVEVLDGSRVVTSQTVAIDGNSEEYDVRMEFVPQKKDRIDYETRVRLASTGPAGRLTAVKDIAVPDRDRVTENNSRRLLVDNREKTYRILYLCGRPTWENKFFRHAMADDKQLKLTSLIRISGAQKKFEFRGRRSSLSNPLFEGFDADMIDQPRYDEAVFMRLGVDESELVKGYPEQEDDLFPFHLVIWGDIEHDFFSLAQLELTRDFVRKRGGTLLLLGGARSFAEGGYSRTLIDDMLPVVLRPVDGESRQAASAQQFSASPTVEGMFTGAWSLDPNVDHNRELWDGMKELYGLNTFSLTRAGASVLARVETDDGRFDGQPLFAVQRYGAGKCAVLATGETWQWQMQENEDDFRHERLWRQVVRNLVTSVPEPVTLRNGKDSHTLGGAVTIDAAVRDARFDERDGLHTSLKIATPSGGTLSLPVDESIHETGLYTGEFTPEESGMHILKFDALDEKDEVVGSLEEAILVEPDRREHQAAQYNPAFLEKISEKTGGSHFSLDQLSEVGKSIPRQAGSEATEIRAHLWHFPPFFVVLTVMLAIEWFVRRKKGYA
jgi:uncharacterized membrane protein